MRVLNALQVSKGAKAEKSSIASLTQPLQFIPRDEKDDRWTATNMDWYEWVGLRQIARKAPRLLKNFNLAKGIIDRGDYMPSEDNENQDLVDTLVAPNQSFTELRFFPIIPNVINTMCSEFAKRNTEIAFRAVDEYSYNELLELKRSEIEGVLLNEATQKMTQKLIAAGMDLDAPEQQEQIQEALSPEKLKTLPEIESYFAKSYRSMLEEWATHQHQVDVDRFGMDELEERNFRIGLTTDSEFWHFMMGEDDYNIEIWNPLLTFYNKSPETRYISQGNWVGRTEMITIADAIDRYGHIMTEEQLKSLESVYPVRAAGYPITGYQNETNYDPTQSHDWNVKPPGIAMRQFMSMVQNTFDSSDIIARLVSQTEGATDFGTNYYLRSSTIYWKSQRKVGKLTKIKDNGEVVVKIVDESYKVTTHPIYNNILNKSRNTDTLVYGEHIDWIYLNETWGGVKLGPNLPSYWGMQAPNGVAPMYLGINQNKIGPLKYQFKGDNSLYGCKLPVEGTIFSEYNTRSVSLVDLMKPFQIGFNVVNNQIADILIDEMGTVIAFDQNMAPQKSLGEDWGKNNYAKLVTTMRTLGVLPLDTSMKNTEGTINNQMFQKLDLEQSARLQSRMALGAYFKNEAYAVIGITPQRMGQQMGRQTATGVEENLNASYAQTEMYFIQHSDWLMPRVHQMRTDLAQFYQSTKPSIRLQYMTSKEEKVNFELNGTKLLLRDFNVYPVAGAVNRGVIEELKKMVISNNTSGASIDELGSLLTAKTLGQMHRIFKKIEQKAQDRYQQEQESTRQTEQEKLQVELQKLKLEQDFDARQAELDRQTDIIVAEIRAAGYGAGVDKDRNAQNDYLDALGMIQASSEYQQKMGLENSKLQSKFELERQKIGLAREKMNTQLSAKNIDLAIARENKTQAELKNLRTKNARDKKKK